jgi:hypothetical protein
MGVAVFAVASKADINRWQMRRPLWVISGQTVPGQKFTFVRYCPKADKCGCSRIVR